MWSSLLVFVCRGQTVIDWDNKLRRKANVRLVQAIDMDAFHRMLLGVLEP